MVSIICMQTILSNRANTNIHIHNNRHGQNAGSRTWAKFNSMSRLRPGGSGPCISHGCAWAGVEVSRARHLASPDMWTHLPSFKSYKK